MATFDPTDPRQLLTDAANAVSAFQSVRQDVFWDEIPQGDLPGWALDPREQERDHEAMSADRGIYGTVPIEYVCYIGVESTGRRSAARGDLDTYRSDYLDELFQSTLPTNNTGRMQKTGRVRFEVEHGEIALMADAISFTVFQNQDFTT